jgi:RNA polymerase sigma factor (TIGR02999 family)
MLGGMADVTRILAAIEAGDPQAAADLLPLVYEELRKLAAARIAAERPGQTLQATALVHEAYLRLVGSDAARPWNGRGHFFGAAAEAMRRILVERARRRQTDKRGGGLARHDVADLQLATPELGEELLALDEALGKLAAVDPAKAELVKLRHFAGLTIEQAALALGISTATANRHWAYARAWLHQAIIGGPPAGEKSGPADRTGH